MQPFRPRRASSALRAATREALSGRSDDSSKDWTHAGAMGDRNYGGCPRPAMVSQRRDNRRSTAWVTCVAYREITFVPRDGEGENFIPQTVVFRSPDVRLAARAICKLL